MRLNSCTGVNAGHITKLKRDYGRSQYYAISCSENTGDKSDISIDVMETSFSESVFTIYKNDYGYSLTVKQIHHISTVTIC